MLLTGEIQRQVFAAFKGKLLKGMIRQKTGATGVDSLGDATGATPVDTALEGFTDNYSDTAKLMGDIPATDLKVMIFGGSCPAIIPGKDDLVMLKALVGRSVVPVWYQLRGPIKTDPATALYECQAFVIKAPS